MGYDAIMCGSRSTFAARGAQTVRWFAGLAAVKPSDVKWVTGVEFKRAFPDAARGFAYDFMKPIPVVDSRTYAIGAIGSSVRPITRRVIFTETDRPTKCGAMCRNAKGPMCDCSCKGENHGAGVAMSRKTIAKRLDRSALAEIERIGEDYGARAFRRGVKGYREDSQAQAAFRMWSQKNAPVKTDPSGIPDNSQSTKAFVAFTNGWNRGWVDAHEWIVKNPPRFGVGDLVGWHNGARVVRGSVLRVNPYAKPEPEYVVELHDSARGAIKQNLAQSSLQRMSRARFAQSDIDLKPTAEMAANARRGLELREKHGKGGTAVGVARARDISNRANLSPRTVKRMHSFFSRHEGNQKGGEDDAGYIAWLLWGGDAGKAWAARKVGQLDKKESNMKHGKKAAFAHSDIIVRSDAQYDYYYPEDDDRATYADEEKDGVFVVKSNKTGKPVGAKRFPTWEAAVAASNASNEKLPPLKRRRLTHSRPGAKAAFASENELKGFWENLLQADGLIRHNKVERAKAMLRQAEAVVRRNQGDPDLEKHGLLQMYHELRGKAGMARAGGKARFDNSEIQRGLSRLLKETGFDQMAKDILKGPSDAATIRKYIRVLKSKMSPLHGNARSEALLDTLDSRLMSRAGAKARFNRSGDYEDFNGNRVTVEESGNTIRVRYPDDPMRSTPMTVSEFDAMVRRGSMTRLSRTGAKAAFSQSAAWIAKYLPALNQWWRDRTDHPTDLDASSERWEIEGVLEDVAEHCREAVPREAKPSWYAAALRDVKKLPHSRKANMKTSFAIGDKVVEDFSWVHKATGRSVSSGGAVPWRTPSERDEWTQRPFFVLYSPRFNQTYGQMYKTRAEAEAALKRSLSSRRGAKAAFAKPTLDEVMKVVEDLRRKGLDDVAKTLLESWLRETNGGRNLNSRPGAKSTHAADSIEASYLRDIAETKRWIEKAYDLGRGSHARELEEQLKDIERHLAEYLAKRGSKSTNAAGDKVSRKIATLTREGYRRDQAVAIAHDMKRRGEI